MRRLLIQADDVELIRAAASWNADGIAHAVAIAEAVIIDPPVATGADGSYSGEIRRRDLGCPLWVISGHLQCKKACPLYPESDHEMAVRDLPKTDVGFDAENVRFTPKSGH
jgi:hypothetical protein